MAKTVFTNGTTVLSTWLNTIFGANAAGGHVHDGADNDGHCPRIPVSGLNFDAAASGTITVTIGTSHLTAQQQGTARWYKFDNLVFLELPLLTGTSNSTNLVISGLTTGLNPYTQRFVPGFLASTPAGICQAAATVNYDGTISVMLGAVSGSQILYATGQFAGSGSKGIYNQVISYLYDAAP
jgi:hypothetical protein